MDFIERIFGISPDGGDGSLEGVYVAATLAAVIAVVYMWRRRREGPSRDAYRASIAALTDSLSP